MAAAATPLPHRRSITRFAILLAMLAGCTVGPDFRSPPAPYSTRFTETVLPGRTTSAAVQGGAAQRFTDRDIPGEWWAVFHSPQIAALVTRALQANPDVEAAQATLRQAKENMRAEQGALFPSVSAGAQMQRQRESLAGFGI